MVLFDSTLVEVLVLTTLAGAAIPAGGLLARIENIRPRWLEGELRHGVIALGGGVLLSAVALVLVPEGIKSLGAGAIAASMLAGGAAFCTIDILLSRSWTQASQLMATLADFLPEAIALGAMLAVNGHNALLLALLIALQNLPEGFNAYRELVAGHPHRRKRHAPRSEGMGPTRVLLLFVLLVPLGPAAGLLGLYGLAGHDAWLGAIMLFGAGGILYLTFQDIAPQARLERHWGPPIGAVLGFLIGVLGHVWIGSH